MNPLTRVENQNMSGSFTQKEIRLILLFIVLKSLYVQGATAFHALHAPHRSALS